MLYVEIGDASGIWYPLQIAFIGAGKYAVEQTVSIRFFTVAF